MKRGEGFIKAVLHRILFEYPPSFGLKSALLLGGLHYALISTYLNRLLDSDPPMISGNVFFVTLLGFPALFFFITSRIHSFQHGGDKRPLGWFWLIFGAGFVHFCIALHSPFTYNHDIVPRIFGKMFSGQTAGFSPTEIVEGRIALPGEKIPLREHLRIGTIMGKVIQKGPGRLVVTSVEPSSIALFDKLPAVFPADAPSNPAGGWERFRQLGDVSIKSPLVDATVAGFVPDVPCFVRLQCRLELPVLVPVKTGYGSFKNLFDDIETEEFDLFLDLEAL